MKTPLLLVKTLLSLMLFSIITTSSIAQNWQQIYFEDFNAHTRIPREFAVQNFSSSLIGYGASGANDDKCASSPFLTYGTYIAYKALLEDGVTYRFGWNLKTKEPGRKIQYMYGSALSLASATHSGSSMGIPVLGLTGPGEDIYSEEIEGTGDVVFLIAAVPSVGNVGSAVYNVHFDNFTIEKLNDSYLNFDVASIEIEEGGSAEVCISLSDHASNAFDVELAFEGGQSPHFTSTQPISLSFNEGDTQQCFTLQTEPDNGVEDDILNYVLNILPPDAGTGVELGDVTTLQIQVLEGDGCPYAGMDRTICEGACTILGCPEELETDYCYKWEPNTYMLEGHEFLTQPTVCPEETTTYTLYVTDRHGNIISEEEVIVNVTHFDIEVSPNPVTICSLDDPVVLDGGEGYYSYIWKNELGEDINYNRYFPVTEAGNYTLTVITDEDCTSSTSFEVVSAIPQISIQADPGALCGTNETLTLTTSGNFANYSWLDIDGEQLGMGGSIIVETSGTYQVVVTDAQGCQATKTIDIEETVLSGVEITASSLGICVSDPAFTPINPQNRDGTCSNSVILEVPSGFYPYEWVNGDGEFLGNEENVEIFSSGIYSVSITDGYGCSILKTIEIGQCLQNELVTFPELPKLCPDGDALVIGINDEFFTYSWGNGATSSSVEITEPGTYEVTVTDDNGCTQISSFDVGQLAGDEELKIEAFQPAVFAGNVTTSVNPQDIMTVVNLDNDDQDKYFDDSDTEISSRSVTEDDELVRIRLKMKTSSGDYNAKLVLSPSTPTGGNSIKIWNSPDKVEGEYILGDSFDMEPPAAGEEWATKEFWIEGVNPHSLQRATKLKFVCSGTTGCTIEEEMAITIIGVRELEWEGIGNGYSLPFVNSNILDLDPNYSDPVLSSFRVFPEKKILSNTTLSDIKDKVNIIVSLTVKPVYPISIYLRPFDVDDPSSKSGPIDPNDFSLFGGRYKGTNRLSYDVTYSLEEDNRGEINGHKSGELEGGALDPDGIIAIRFTEMDQSLKKIFTISSFAGDNYRIIANADKDFLTQLKNKDKTDMLQIKDKYVKKEVLYSDFYVAPILTVWRALYVEFDSMRNMGSDDNLVKGVVTDFNVVSSTITYTELTGLKDELGINSVSLKDSPVVNSQSDPTLFNPSSLDLGSSYSGWKGRFENGEILFGEALSRVNVTGNAGDKIKISGNIIPVGTSIPFKIEEGTKMATGGITKIEKIGVEFIFTITMNVSPTDAPLADFTSNAIFKVTGAMQDMSIALIDVTNSKIKTSNLFIPFKLWDDDAQMADNLLPYNFSTDLQNAKAGLSAYEDAYIKVIDYPTGFNTLGNITFKADYLFSGSSDRKIPVHDPVGFEVGNSYNEIYIVDRKRDSKENERFFGDTWIAYTFAGFQTGKWRKDADPNNEIGIDPQYSSTAYSGTYPTDEYELNFVTLGLTPTSMDFPTSNNKVSLGSDFSLIPFENFRDTGFSYLMPISIAHEIGHQFGLGHSISSPNLMHIELNPSSNNGKFTNKHINLLRSRKTSPGVLN